MSESRLNWRSVGDADEFFSDNPGPVSCLVSMIQYSGGEPVVLGLANYRRKNLQGFFQLEENGSMIPASLPPMGTIERFFFVPESELFEGFGHE